MADPLKLFLLTTLGMRSTAVVYFLSNRPKPRQHRSGGASTRRQPSPSTYVAGRSLGPVAGHCASYCCSSVAWTRIRPVTYFFWFECSAPLVDPRLARQCTIALIGRFLNKCPHRIPTDVRFPLVQLQRKQRSTFRVYIQLSSAQTIRLLCPALLLSSS
ncbi:hypothetical protein J6590_021603 [Homalodisca vitripennis]|nr:hypothetical protein J6590_021603 [Homalodisca vitripennis]